MYNDKIYILNKEMKKFNEAKFTSAVECVFGKKNINLVFVTILH